MYTKGDGLVGLGVEDQGSCDCKLGSGYLPSKCLSTQTTPCLNLHNSKVDSKDEEPADVFFNVCYPGIRSIELGLINYKSEFPKIRGTLYWGPYNNEDPLVRVPYFRKLPNNP